MRDRVHTSRCMRRLSVVVGLCSLTIGVGLADAHPNERLTKDQIRAAEKAAETSLPAVDKAAAKKCTALADDTVSDLATKATCYRAAGALGLAIAMWKEVARRDQHSPEDMEARRALGPAYEAAGRFADAANAHDEYALRFAGEADAADHLIRAICTWRQLGLETDAERGFRFLTRKKPKRDSATLCDTVRPIVVPPAPSPAS